MSAEVEKRRLGGLGKGDLWLIALLFAALWLLLHLAMTVRL
jgi:hypothetical protein